MADRDRLRRKWRRHKTDMNYNLFKESRNQVQNIVRKAKQDYYLSVFGDCRKPAYTWMKLRQLGLIKTKANPTRLPFSADDYNSFLTDHQSDAIENEEVFLGELAYDESKFYWKNVEDAKVRTAVSTIASNSTGHDGVSRDLIRLAMPCILPVLTHIFNYSLNSGVFPTIWRSALVCPVPKVKSPSELQHYRPISLLCVLSKALERIAARQMVEYLEPNNLLDPYQNAYRRGYSTETALIRVLDDVREAADQRKVTIAVFFDFTKAFDNVNHRRLINKMMEMNFSNSVLRWMCSYLFGRTQAVRDTYSNTVSAQLPINKGVPQGSVLGPLLFSLYVSDFGTILRECRYNYYADDLLVYLHTEPSLLGEALNKINMDICNVVNWATSNGLKLNASKTSAIIFGTARHVHAIDLQATSRVVVDGAFIPWSNSVTYLGVTLTSALSWETYISNTISRANAALHRLKIFKHLFSSRVRSRLVSSLIYPIFDYGCTLLMNLTDIDSLRLHRAFNRCVRFIFQIKWYEHITPYYEKLRWLKLKLRRIFFMGNMLFKILETGRPRVLYDGYSFRDPQQYRETRTIYGTLILPLCRTEYYRQSYRCVSVDIWNDIPVDIRNESFINFKYKFFDHLLNLNAQC